MAKKRSKNQNKNKKAQKKQNKEQLWFAVAAAVLAVLAFIVFSGRGNGNVTNNGTLPPEINTATGKQMFDEGAFMLDVRNPDEWEMYHVDGATLIPLPELEARVNEVPRDREIVVICNSGNRSQVGRDILLDAGFENVTSIAGGIQGWMSAGYDFVKGN
jgi:rhodanese-related sulfurtransferase